MYIKKKFRRMILAALFAGSVVFVPQIYGVENLNVVSAEIKTVTGTGETRMGDSETLEKVIERAKKYAMRNAIEKAGVYIRSHSELHNSELEDEIITLAGGIVKIVDSDKEIISKDNSVKVIATVIITIDTDDLQKEIDKYFEKNTQKVKIEISQEKIENKTPEIYNIALAKQKTNEAFKLCEDKKFDYALKVANEAVYLNPNNAESYHARGWANIALKNYEQAIADYNKNIELNPENKWAYHDLGVIYKDLKNYDKAIFYYTKAITLSPDNAGFYNERGGVYIYSGNFNEAYFDFNKAIQLEPNRAWHHDCLGWCYNCIGEHDKAISECNKALKIDPNYSWAYHTRGEAYRGLKKYKLAIAEYDKSVRIKSDWAPVYWHRGECYQALGETEKANADFAMAKKLGWKG